MEESEFMLSMESREDLLMWIMSQHRVINELNREREDEQNENLQERNLEGVPKKPGTRACSIGEEKKKAVKTGREG